MKKECLQLENLKNMPYSDFPLRTLNVLHTSRYLFNNHGFHNDGIDQIIASAKHVIFGRVNFQ